jgi:hypothetical protein
MAPLVPRGNPHSLVWVVVEQPYKTDIDKGFVFSGGYGYVFHKMMQDAGLQDYYVISRRPDFEHTDTYTIVESFANQYQPPIIIPLGNSLGFFCPETKRKVAAEQDADLEKYAGSLLTAHKFFNYPHYILSTLPPDVISGDWSLRDICTSLDLGKVRSELEYYKIHSALEPLPQRNLVCDFDKPGGFTRLLDWLRRFKSAKILSVDIETVYPNKKSLYWPHPGYPITIGMANSSKEGISFRLFRENKTETSELWRVLNDLLCSSNILGQNFFDFDAPRLEKLGFSINYDNITDTLIRHHILWPELPHKLQFQTRQYTRQSYYKDDGHHWNLKDMEKLMRYNALDCCITYEIWEAQEKEFDERPYLR